MHPTLRPVLFACGSLTALFLLLNLFWDDSPALSHAEPVLSVAGFASNSYPGQEATYRIELLNHTDQIVYDGVISITLPVSFTYVPSSTIALGEGWPLASREPAIDGQSLTWGPYHLPAAGNKAHNPYGIHTMMHGCVDMHLHLEGAKPLVGNGGFVTQLFYGIDTTTTGPSQCAINFVSEAYARNLIPILRLEGHFVNGIWQAPDPGPHGDYAPIARAFANFVAGLPRRDTNPLYIQVWNEPDLWIEWGGSPNAGQYARFFVAVSNAIRQLGDGRIRLLNAGLTPGNTPFIDAMLRVPGFRDAFDAWSSHCYPYNHPAWYNNHAGTARYGTYAIDCYRQELAVIQRYGRSGVKVIVTETGYELGSNVYSFEGFPAINETNRAAYISSAFADYWRNWPEVIAVTPFELSDTSGHWHKFDWIYPTLPYPSHPQYEAVKAHSKPDGGLEPYGYQIIFKVKTDPYLAAGVYTGQLSGRDQDGHTTTGTVPIQLYEAGAIQLTYLPLMMGPPRRDGPWYLSQADSPSPGAIVPDTFLQSAPPSLTSLATVTPTAVISLSGEPQVMALADSAGLGAVLLIDGRLEIFNMTDQQIKGSVIVGNRPQSLTADASLPGQVYVGLDNLIVLVDLRTGQVIGRWAEPGRWRGLAQDAATRRLFAVDASGERLLILRDDLSRSLATVPLAEQPDQLVFDAATRQLYISFPAVPQILTIDADTLNPTNQTLLVGGPILDLALAPAPQRLYVLNALAPSYRGLTELDASTLAPLRLVAGAAEFPLRSATALTVTPAGHLLVSETTGLWQISPDDFTVRTLLPGSDLSLVSQIIVGQQGTIYVLEPTARRLRIYQ